MSLTPDEVARLSPQDRLALIAQLWDSLDDADVPVSEAQQAELARRLASFEEDRAAGISWEELREHLRQRLR